MTDTTEESWFSKLQRKFAADEAANDSTLEETEAIKAERKANEGTTWEWAQMQPDKSIAIRITHNGIDGVHGTADTTVDCSDEQYEISRKEFGLEIPGDTRHIKKRLINSEWVVEFNQKTNRQGTASSP